MLTAVSATDANFATSAGMTAREYQFRAARINVGMTVGPAATGFQVRPPAALSGVVARDQVKAQAWLESEGIS